MANRRIILVSLLASLYACASANGEANNEATPSALPLPQLVGNARHFKTEYFTRGSLGRLYRYRDGRFRPDVYVYPASEWPDVATQAFDFVQTLNAERNRRWFDAYEIMLDEPIRLPVAEDTLTGHEIVFRIRRGSQNRDSYFAVLAVRDQYVKFRITQAPDDNAPVKSRAFVHAWLSAYLGTTK